MLHGIGPLYDASTQLSFTQPPPCSTLISPGSAFLPAWSRGSGPVPHAAPSSQTQRGGTTARPGVDKCGGWGGMAQGCDNACLAPPGMRCACRPPSASSAPPRPSPRSMAVQVVWALEVLGHRDNNLLKLVCMRIAQEPFSVRGLNPVKGEGGGCVHAHCPGAYLGEGRGRGTADWAG